MTKIEKLLDKFLENPGSVKYPELEKILLYFGFHKIQGKGSHVKFNHPIFKITFITSIHNNECKKSYKKEVAQGIRWLMGKAKESGDETFEAHDNS